MNAKQRRKAWRKRNRETQKLVDALLDDPAIQAQVVRHYEELLVFGSTRIGETVFLNSTYEAPP